ncbi:MAG: hypothetical protein JW950_06690 [Deltaproteobacteria bacterium]|nr:hypothetical protein [Deltaproteobacteria bacterium]
MRMLSFLVFLSAAVGVFPSPAPAEVFVRDTVSPENREVILSAETKGIFFVRGGELVEFFIDGKSIGKNLSGGDGVALKRFVPPSIGLYKIRVRSGSDEDEGLLLTLRRTTPMIFIDVEGSLFEKPYIEKAKSGSTRAVRTIRRKHSVIYLQTGRRSVRALKSWLSENRFPAAPVLSWRRGKVFEDMAEQKMRIKAVVGRPEIIESAKSYKPLAFSFDGTDDAEVVRDWEDVLKGL